MLTDPKTSRSLVWLSLILLLAFLIYWNVNQYHSERNELEQDLNDQMNLAYSTFNDSIFTSIFDIISQNDSTLSNSSSGVTINSNMVNGNGAIELHNHSGYAHRDTSISIMFSSNQVISSDTNDAFNFLPINGNMVKTFLSDSSTVNMGHLFDSVTKEKQFEIILNESRNSNDHVKKYFVENLTKLNLPSDYNNEFLPEGQQHLDGKIAIAYRNMNHEDPMLHATFSNYKPYLLKKITPSLLMSSVLFSIVSLAFFMILKTSNEQQRLADIRGEFMSNMTHELKTPIATVGVALEALSDYGAMNDQKRKEEYLDISKHELNRLSILVDKVLQMSSFEKGAAVMEFEKLDLKVITDQMINYMKLPFEKNKVRFSYDLKGQNFTIRGDQVHMTNVLYNLIDNAIKYSDNTPVIDINISEESKYIKFKIKDKGIGIPKEYQGKIFDRFFRVPTHDIHNVKGHGVGLNYVSDVINKHKGLLHIESEVGQGTSIIFQIPKIV